MTVEAVSPQDAPTRKVDAAAPIAEARTLKDLRVLVDGHNLDLEEGTGLATYGRTLLRALANFGIQTSLLFARNMSKMSDPLTQEAEFYDRNIDPPRGRIGAIARSALRTLDVYTNLPKRALAVPQRQAVLLQPDHVLPNKMFNAPRIFDIAMSRHTVRGDFTTVILPERVDVAHLTFPLPVQIKGAKHVTTIHDLVPMRLPYTTLDDKREMVRRHRKAVAQSDLILTVSECSKRDIVELLDVDPSKVHVTYQPTDIETLRPSEARHLDAVLGQMGLTPRRYCLFVGAIEPKKNLRRLLQAYLEADPPVPLVVVGKRAWLWEREIGPTLKRLESGGMKQVIFLDYVTQRDLRFLYAGAICFMFPSLYEGFGLPVLEAMRFGLPVLTSKVSSLPEVAGEAALYVDPFDAANIRVKIERMLSDQKLRTWLSERSVEQAQSFSTAIYEKRLAAAYSTIL